MSADLSTIGLGVDSSGVKGATKDLEDFAKQGARTETAADRFSAATKRLSDQSQVASKSVEGLTSKIAVGGFTALQVDRMISSLVGTVANSVKQFVALGFAIGDYQDIADRTMADPAGLASLQTAADVSNTSITTIATSIQQMERQLASAKGESSAAAIALKSVGLNIEEFKKLSGDEKVRALAVALRGYADEGQKVAVVQAVMGRGGAQNLGFIKELGEETGRYTIITAEMIRKADEAGDAIKRQQSELKQMVSVLAVDLAPVVSEFQGALSDTAKAILGIGTEAERLEKSTAIRDFAQESVLFLTKVVEVALLTGSTIRAIADSFKVVLADVNVAMNVAKYANPGGVIRLINDKSARDEVLKDIEDRNKALATANARWDKLLNTDPYAFSASLGARFAAKNDKPPAVGDQWGSEGRARPKPSIPYDPEEERRREKAERDATRAAEKAQREAERHLKDYERLKDSVEQYTAAQETLALVGERASSMDQLRARVMAELNDTTKNYSLTERNAMVGMLAYAEAQFKAAEETKRAIESAKLTSKLREDEIKTLNSLTSEVAKATTDLERYGKTRAQLHAMEQRDLETKREEIKWTAEQNGVGTEQYDILMAQVRALDLLIQRREQLYQKQRADRQDPNQGVKNAIDKYNEEVQDMGTAMEQFATRSIKSVEDALTAMATGGKADIKSMISAIIAEFFRLQIIKPMLNNLLGNLFGGGGGMNFLSLLLGGGSGAGSMGVSYALPTAGVRLGKAAGGMTPPWSEVEVGELGRERINTGPNWSRVTPNDRMEKQGPKVNIVYSPTINVDSRSDAAQVRQIAIRASAEGQKVLIETLRSKGVINA